MKRLSKCKDNPRLEQRETTDGQISLYLEYYLGRQEEIVLDEWGEPVLYESGIMAGKPKYKVKHNRRKEKLNLYLVANPRTPIERQQNREVLQLAKRIRQEREQELLEDREGYRLKSMQKKINFLDYFQNYIDNYTKKDLSMLKGVFQRFKDFLKDTPEYNRFANDLKPENINKDMIVTFTEYLQSRGKGEGAKSYYARFKKVINYAVEHDIITKNPCTGVSIKIDGNTLRKEVLSMEEIKQLISTKSPKQNQEVRRAFIFCLYCGLRFCDIKDLTFANVDYSNKLLKFEQSKTKGHSANSGVIIPLNESLLQLIGEPKQGENKNSLIFNLPTYEMCWKSLQRWVENAGINKHISWHCARHSFAVNILNNGANIKTVAELLGHSGLQCTEKYVRAVDKLKEEAINSLPNIDFNL